MEEQTGLPAEGWSCSACRIEDLTDDDPREVCHVCGRKLPKKG